MTHFQHKKDNDTTTASLQGTAMRTPGGLMQK